MESPSRGDEREFLKGEALKAAIFNSTYGINAGGLVGAWRGRGWRKGRLQG